MTEKTNEQKILEMLESISGRIEKLEANADKTKLDAASIHAMIKPHADSLRNCAAAMSAAGIGQDEKRGHATVLNHMADQMEADAATGKVPHIYQAPDFLYASNGKTEKVAAASDDKAMKDIQASIADISSKLTDMEKQRFDAAKEPDRKTLSPGIEKLLAKTGVLPKEEKKITADEVSNLMKNKNVPIAARFAAKLELKEAGKMA